MTGRGAFEGIDCNTTAEALHSAGIAIRYVFHHELSHIWNGKLEWKSLSNKSDREIAESAELRTLNAAFEFDADARAGWAARRLLSMCMNISVPNPNGETPLNFRVFSIYFNHRELTTTFEFQTFRYVASIYLAIRLGYMLTGEPSSGNLHPLSIDRLLWFVGGSINTYAVGTNQPYGITRDIVYTAAIQSELDFCKVTGAEHLSIFEPETVEASLRRRDVLQAAWNDNHSYIKTLNRGRHLLRYDTSPHDAVGSELQKIAAGQANVRGSFEILDVDAFRYGLRIMHNANEAISGLKPKLLEDYSALDTAVVRVTNQFNTDNKIFEDPQLVWTTYLKFAKKVFDEPDNLRKSDNHKIWVSFFDVILLSDMLVQFIMISSKFDEQTMLDTIEEVQMSSLGAKFICDGNIYDLGDTAPSLLNQFCLKTVKSNGFVGLAPSRHFTVIVNDNISTVEGAIRATLPFFISIRGQLIFHQVCDRESTPSSLGNRA